MTRCTLVLSGFLALASFSVLNLNVPALAQIIPDATLGNENSTVTPGATVRGGEADLIDGGAIRGSNLFHSFQEFNVGEGQRVYFANPDGIDSILSRITGGNPSNIFGTLGVDGTADLFFLNPNGIVFGESAVLDVEGSFYASTAEAIPLGDGVYSATEPEQSSLLTVSPSALFSSYLSDTSGDIESRGSLAAQENLTLAANRLDLQGQLAAGGDLTLLGIDTLQIRDLVDVPFVGFAGGDLLVQGNELTDIVALSHPDSGLYSYGDMVLRSANPVGGDAHYWSASSFQVETLDGTIGDLYSPIDPVIRTFGDVAIAGYVGTSLHILSGGSVQIGLANITGPAAGTPDVDFLQEAVELSDGTTVPVDGAAQPTLDVRAGVLPETIGFPDFNFFPGLVFNPIFTAAPSSADIVIGDVLIDAPNALILLTNQYQPNLELLEGNIQIESQIASLAGGGGIIVGNLTLNLSGSGEVFVDARNDIAVRNSVISTISIGDSGGDIVLLAAGDVRFDNPDNRLSGAITGTPPTSTSQGGDIKITSANLFLLDGAELTTSTNGIGNAGNVIISTENRVVLDGTGLAVIVVDGIPQEFSTRSGITSDTNLNATGDSGTIDISANSLEVLDGARISASTFGQGNGGSVLIAVEDSAVFDGTSPGGELRSAVGSEVGLGATGEGGSVEIAANSLEVINGALLTASTFGAGDAGSMSITVEEKAVFDGTSPDGQFNSGAASEVMFGATGEGGGVEIAANFLEVTNGAALNASTSGQGNAGDVVIEIGEYARFDGTTPNGQFSSGAFSTVNAGATGDGGNVQLSTNSLEVTNGAALNASTSGQGNAGNVVIEIGEHVRFDGTTPNEQFGSGAFSTVNAGATGDGGNVQLSANSLEVTNGAALNASTLGQGNAGNVVMEIGEHARFDGTTPKGQFSSGASSTVNAGATGDGGNVQLSANSLEVTNGAVLNASTLGQGNAGDVVIEIGEHARFDGTTPNGQFVSGAFSTVNAGATGDGGNVQLSANSLEVTNGAALNASTFSEGDAGNVTIRAEGPVVFNGTTTNGGSSTATSKVQVGAEGNAGNVEISANSLEIINGAVLSASTQGDGNAGDVIVNITDFVNIEGFVLQGEFEGSPSGIFTRNININEIGTGAGGDVRVTTSRLSLSDGAVIDSRTANDQSGGNVNIEVGFLELLQGGQIVATSDGSGSAGSISINALDRVQINGVDPNFDERFESFSRFGDSYEPQSNISVRSLATGRTGNILINAPVLELEDQGQIIAESAAVDGGNIVLNLGDLLLLRNGSLISTTAGTEQSGGNGGNITISVPFIVAIPEENSDIAADAFEGSGGNVNITARGVFGIEPRPERTPLSDITASSELGVSGIINLNVLDTGFIENNLSSFEDTIIDTSTLTAGSCIARTEEDHGSFVVTGRDGLPQRPGDTGIAAYPTGTVRMVAESTANQPIQEPDGVYQLPDGRLVLSRECGYF
jgi:filamentous hemagglutinin family protein